jgi:hypothetical protein
LRRLELGDEGIQWCLNELKALARRELVRIEGEERRVSTWRIHLAESLGDHISRLEGHAYAIVPEQPEGVSLSDMLNATKRETKEANYALASNFLHVEEDDSKRVRIVLGCDELTRAVDVILPRFHQLPNEIHYATDEEAAFGMLKLPSEAPNDSVSRLFDYMSWISSGSPTVIIGGDRDFEEICLSAWRTSFLSKSHQAKLAEHTTQMLIAGSKLLGMVLWSHEGLSVDGNSSLAPDHL